MTKALIYIIGVYQKTLSPDHGWLRSFYPHGYCRFHPTCSQYAKQSLALHGAWRGGGLTLRRLLRCHPWGAWGFDPVPPGRLK